MLRMPAWLIPVSDPAAVTPDLTLFSGEDALLVEVVAQALHHEVSRRCLEQVQQAVQFSLGQHGAEL